MTFFKKNENKIACVCNHNSWGLIFETYIPSTQQLSNFVHSWWFNPFYKDADKFVRVKEFHFYNQVITWSFQTKKKKRKKSIPYSHSQWLFYEFVSKITNKLVKQSLRVTVCLLCFKITLWDKSLNEGNFVKLNSFYWTLSKIR